MISVTLNSKKGNNLGIIPSSQVSSYVYTTAAASINAIFLTIFTNNTILLGDTFVWNGITHTFTNCASLTLYYFSPGLSASIPVNTVIPITSNNSQLLGYKNAAGVTLGTIPLNSSVISFGASSLITTSNIISSYMSLLIANEIYSIKSINYSSINNISMMQISPPLKSATVNNSTVAYVYSKTFHTVEYKIDNYIFEFGKKYEMSFTFSSNPCVINQCFKPASVYASFSHSSSFESGSNNLISTNRLGILKTNLIHSNMNSALFGNVNYSTLIADDSNKPIIINSPKTNIVTISILNDDDTPFVDNSIVGLCPPYLLTLHFKEIK